MGNRLKVNHRPKKAVNPSMMNLKKAIRKSLDKPTKSKANDSFKFDSSGQLVISDNSLSNQIYQSTSNQGLMHQGPRDEYAVYLPQFQAYVENKTNEGEDLEGLKKLIVVIADEYEKLVNGLKERQAKGLVGRLDVYLLFAPGTEVVIRTQHGDVGGIVKSVFLESTFFGKFYAVAYTYIDSNGSSLGQTDGYLKFQYQDIYKAEDLAIRIATLEDKDRLAQRGLSFRKYATGPHYVKHTGNVYVRRWFGEIPIKATGRFMVDNNFASVLFPGTFFDSDHKDYGTLPEQVVQDKDLWRCAPTVVGFSLSEKVWGKARLDAISDVDFKDKAFEYLVLDEDRKKIIKALVKNYSSGVEDFIGGKGGGCIFLLEGPPGTGKCLGKGTPVLKQDGSIVPVESIKAGDRLMGPDGKARNVLAINTGTGPLYKVHPVKGDPWVCNDVHMMTLVKTGTEDIVDIPLNEWHNLSDYKRNSLKLFSVGVDSFAGNNEPLPIDPYFLGVWFGDGSKFSGKVGGPNIAGVSISKPDPEIQAICNETAVKWGLTVRVNYGTGGCPTMHIVQEGGKANAGRSNALLDTLRTVVGPNTEVPKQYMCASKEDRLAFLAGFIDTDGFLDNNSYEIIQKQENWAQAICFMARSVGLHANIVKKEGGYTKPDGSEFKADYYRVYLSGNTDMIPCRIPRKQASPRQQVKNALRTGFSTEYLGTGDYYGFTLDGDGRFLLGDFTVTHNTLSAEAVSETLHKPLYMVSVGELGTEPKELEKALKDILHLAERWGAVILLDEADIFLEKRNDNDILRNAMVGVFLRLLEYHSGVMFLTTNRVKNFDEAFISRMSVMLSYKELSKPTRKTVWDNIIASAPAGTVSGDINTEFLSGFVINGRQIKNTFRIAHTLAKSEGRSLTQQDVLNTLAITGSQESTKENK